MSGDCEEKIPKISTFGRFLSRKPLKKIPTKSCLDDIMNDQNFQNIFKICSKKEKKTYFKGIIFFIFGLPAFFHI